MMTARERKVLNEAVRRIKALTRKIDELEAKIGSLLSQGALNQQSEVGLSRTYADTEFGQAETGLDTSLANYIRETIQKALNEGYFKIQKHTHEDDNQGGDAFAAKGGYLI